jgi:hypothetical protein
MVRHGARPARRRLTWVDYTSTGLVVGATGHALNIDLLSQFKTAGGEVNGATVMRTHLVVWPATAVAAADAIRLGLMVTGTNEVQASFALGATAFNNPTDFPYLDWMYSRKFRATPTLNPWGSTNEMSVDLRSKRKMEDLADTLLLSVVNTNSGVALNVDVSARVLLALP